MQGGRPSLSVAGAGRDRGVMRTLVVESMPGCGTDVVEALGAAGHQIARCHAPGADTFPCAALITGCPLDEPEGIDVVVDARTLTELDPTASEAGVTCALRRGVPVVVLGDDVLDPFGGWVHEVPSNADPVQACAHALAADAKRRAAPLRDEARRLLTGAGLPTAGTDVIVDRLGREVRITVTLPRDTPERLNGPIATRILAIDAAGTWPGSTTDVSVDRASPA